MKQKQKSIQKKLKKSQKINTQLEKQIYNLQSQDQDKQCEIERANRETKRVKANLKCLNQKTYQTEEEKNKIEAQRFQLEIE